MRHSRRDMSEDWRTACGHAVTHPSTMCDGFASAYMQYAASHPSASMGHPSAQAASLVIEDAWAGEGLGFISGVAAQWLLLAMATGRALYLDVRAAHCFEPIPSDSAIHSCCLVRRSCYRCPRGDRHSFASRGSTCWSTSAGSTASTGGRGHR
eukprot:2883875-Prymnesium_polylepis.1